VADLRATYRLQLHPGFGFAAARELVPYLADLGISHLYLSPTLQAREGSTHGYDVVDPSRLSDALGGEAGFRQLAAAAHARGMGLILDIVPNHMGADDANRYWSDPQLRRTYFDVDQVSGRHRRFFDIDDLAAIRVEDPEVFETVHGLTLGLLAEGLIDGLRVDHPDGLTDPTGYLHRLRRRAGLQAGIWVEKILAATESLPHDWPVTGTVGYEFLNDLVALFTDPAGEGPLTDLWHRVSGDERPFGAHAHEAKLEQAEGPFAAEVERLARVPGAPSQEAVVAALAALPVYRTYLPSSAGEYLTRFQQTTPAIMAKGVEDTAAYRYGRLLALNEVGGDPDRFHITPADFHAANAARAAAHPQSLLTTMTHDAKRSADVRARIVALSHLTSEWVPLAERWLALDHGASAVDPVERYFVLQTLAGAHPIEPERLDAYLVKALREAKRTTNWIEPDVAHEAAVQAYAHGLLADSRFLREFEPLVKRVALLGKRIGLAWLALKLTAPGVPDIYQGDELEFRALVDPDNRRPVDFDLRRASLEAVSRGGLPDRAAHKLYLIRELLALRARRPQAFTSYEPIATGDGTVGFVRGGEVLTLVAPGSAQRLPAPGTGWSAVVQLPGVSVFARI
jgi:(1->4)-alpha-D-glucan 1-alpha-D-glucosylmutase